MSEATSLPVAGAAGKAAEELSESTETSRREQPRSAALIELQIRSAALDAFRANNQDVSPSDALPHSAERREAEGRGPPQGLRRPETRACRQAKARGGNAE